MVNAQKMKLIFSVFPSRIEHFYILSNLVTVLFKVKVCIYETVRCKKHCMNSRTVLLPCYRLLLEDSDEEEGDLCRICQMGEESASNPLIQPCRCAGSLQYVHQECIKRWLCSKISSGK